MQKKRVLLLLVWVLAGCAGVSPNDEHLESPNENQYPPSMVPTEDQPPTTDTNWTRPADGAVMVFVSGGTFLMGSTDAEIDDAVRLCEEYQGSGKCMREWFEDEGPQHPVILEAFWIDQTEVTNTRYALCVEAGECALAECFHEFPITAPDQPVGCVSWFDAQAYCQWAGGRLPSEAEWEYAARGPQGNIFPWGNDFDPARTNYCDVNCTYRWRDDTFDDGFGWPSPVGSFSSGVSWSGALDMAGNNWEWVADWYDPDYYAVSPGYDPQGPVEGMSRVLRGGSCHFFPPYLRNARRSGNIPTSVYASGGFRCVVDVFDLGD